MKFIHLTDSHVVGGGALLYGADPVRRLSLAVESINTEHADAQFVVVTGDLVNWGSTEEYLAFAGEIKRLNMPVHLMVGNHDDASNFASVFPESPRDSGGFLQFAFQTPYARCLCLDTSSPGVDEGILCATRLEWLSAELESSHEPILLFMHHPPVNVGIRGMDAMKLKDADAFHAVIAPHKARIRHLFFGHVHRAIFGNWRGISFSCMRGLNQQLSLDLSEGDPRFPGNLANPAYGVVLLDDENVTVHLHEFADKSPSFGLAPPKGVNPVKWQLELRHSGFDDL